MPDIIWAEGFEHYGTGTGAPVTTRMTAGLWSQLNGFSLGTVDNGSARTGDHYFVVTSNNATVRRSFGSRSQVGISFGLRFSSLPSDEATYFQLRDGSNSPILTLIWGTDGSVQVRRLGTSGTLLATSDQVLSAGTWHHIELVVTISPTVGAIELRVDKVPEVILADLNLGSTNMTQAAWGTLVTSGQAHHLDDIVVHTGEDFIGPARVITVYPAGDGSPFDWSVTGAGSGAEAVDDEVPDDDTSYIQADEIGYIADFTMPTLPDDVENIVGIFITPRAKQSDAGATSIQLSMLSGAEESEGAIHSLSTGYTYKEDAFNSDPNTDSAWTKSGFESAILRIEKV